MPNSTSSNDFEHIAFTSDGMYLLGLHEGKLLAYKIPYKYRINEKSNLANKLVFEKDIHRFSVEEDYITVFFSEKSK